MNPLQKNSPVSILTPTNFDEAMRFAELICQSGMVPKDYVNKPAAVLVAMQMGAELGLQPMQAIQSISVINGRPAIWGDALLAIARNSGKCESIREVYDETSQIATCIVKRKGEQHEIIKTFGMADAQVAGLVDAKVAGVSRKQGPWTQYPKRMCQLRARGFALRDAFPDYLRGIVTTEEAMDTPAERDVTPASASAKVADLTARLTAPVQQPVVEQPVVQQQPEPAIEQLQQTTEARQQAMQDNPQDNDRPVDRAAQLKQQLQEHSEVTEKDRIAQGMVMEAIKSAKTKAELQDIASDARKLHPDLQADVRVAYQSKVNDFHQTR